MWGIIMNKHKWHDEIVAWASGEEIEWRRGIDDWQPKLHEYWYTDDDLEYRIKPTPKEPQYLYVMESGSSYSLFDSPTHPHPKVKCIGKIKLEQDDE